jgi:hypothetical protein
MQGGGSKGPFPKGENLGENPRNNHCGDCERNGSDQLGAALGEVFVVALFKVRGPAKEHDGGAFK